MKLLYITNGITGSGGLERVLAVKTALLVENFGYEIHILSLNENGKATFFKFSDKIKRHSIEISGNKFQYFLKYKSGIQKIVDEVKPDVISVCDDALKGFFLPYLIKTKSKWIHESHASFLLGNKGKGLPLKKKIQHQIKQILGKNFSKIILLTEANKKEWSLKNLLVIPNPLSFESQEISSLKNKKIIAVGSYSFNKGYDLLLKIWAKIETNFPNWELNVYGRNTKEYLQTEAENLNLKNIHFFSSVPDIEKKYVESSFLVLPSRSEGFGMVLIEAMSCGLPVISFDCPHGPKEIISNGKDGFLIENGNIDEFSTKIKTLINDENLRQEMGKAAKLNSKKFNAETIVKQWDELFKKI
ncbi:Glycosyltransferase involved in cell wall bisynthesis [Halpernia humi]|uniref:Glycosyltransferase involved in cell wall bisynthesis n=1 Tax=Halpernia humi TaxID=493375 RepID=A0A1H6ANL6_9FLAO|nr:glycosyltransferase family 4 protein [Halpernia humi]SEG50298.1 Glycosyltransferase involved in cell wall bisynthesis [Halpernia humi]